MEKEELRKLIRETTDEKVLVALWELYELKFGHNINYTYPFVTTTTGVTYKDTLL